MLNPYGLVLQIDLKMVRYHKDLIPALSANWLTRVIQNIFILKLLEISSAQNYL